MELIELSLLMDLYQIQTLCRGALPGMSERLPLWRKVHER